MQEEGQGSCVAAEGILDIAGSSISRLLAHSPARLENLHPQELVRLSWIKSQLTGTVGSGSALDGRLDLGNCQSTPTTAVSMILHLDDSIFLWCSVTCIVIIHGIYHQYVLKA